MDKEVTQAWRTDGSLSDVIIRLLASCSLNDDIRGKNKVQPAHTCHVYTEYTVTFALYLQVMCIIGYGQPS